MASLNAISVLLPVLGLAKLGLEVRVGENPQRPQGPTCLSRVTFKIATRPVMKRRRGGGPPKPNWTFLCSLSFCGVPRCWGVCSLSCSPVLVPRGLLHWPSSQLLPLQLWVPAFFDSLWSHYLLSLIFFLNYKQQEGNTRIV